GAQARTVAPDARDKLYAYDWPGNVRELENAVLRAALLAQGSQLRADDLNLGRNARSGKVSNDTEAPLSELIHRRLEEMVSEDGAEPRDLHQRIIAELEKPLIELALARARGNQVQAARMLGLNRNTLRKKLADHAIAITRTPGG
ncbi:MAG: helix-turn-helix domain-containing protein, partial [Candidatus Binataceae bacterium]